MTEAAVLDALRRVVDPELGINLVDLGLVYGVHVDGPRARITMTMTSPACPLGRYLTDLVDSTVKGLVPGIEEVAVDLVWEPRWGPDRISDEARRQLDGGE